MEKTRKNMNLGKELRFFFLICLLVIYNFGITESVEYMVRANTALDGLIKAMMTRTMEFHVLTENCLMEE